MDGMTAFDRIGGLQAFFGKRTEHWMMHEQELNWSGISSVKRRRYADILYNGTRSKRSNIIHRFGNS